MARRRKEERAALREEAIQRSWSILNSYGFDEGAEEAESTDLMVDLTSQEEVLIPDDVSTITEEETARAEVPDYAKAREVVDAEHDELEAIHDVAGDVESISDREPEDPIVDVRRQATSPGPDAPGISRIMAGYQREIVDWISYAMNAWLEYFFVLGDGTPEQRLDAAGEDLARVARQLSQIAFLVSDLQDSRASINRSIETYGASLEMWANGIDMISRGTLLRRGRFAREGFRMFDEGSRLVEPIVDIGEPGPKVIDVAGPLEVLGVTKPSKRVPRREVRAAKGPWERALKGAGSPIRVLRNEPGYL